MYVARRINTTLKAHALLPRPTSECVKNNDTAKEYGQELTFILNRSEIFIANICHD